MNIIERIFGKSLIAELEQRLAIQLDRNAALERELSRLAYADRTQRALIDALRECNRSLDERNLTLEEAE